MLARIILAYVLALPVLVGFTESGSGGHTIDVTMASTVPGYLQVFFDTGQALLLPEGKAELDKLATALVELDKQIPSEIAWVLRVDGHTDVRPINSPLFKSNWELSSARAISVVQYLVSLGVPAQRLVAAGFAEFQPLDTAPTEDAYKRNRRIELKLTER